MISESPRHTDGSGRAQHAGTRDAHVLYAKPGFTPLKKPELFMEILDSEVYSKDV